MKIKIISLIILSLILGINFYLIFNLPDKYTESKSKLSSFQGSNSYLGRLSFWQLLVQNNDWDNASSLESKLNQDQVKNYKLSYQPIEIQKKINNFKIDYFNTADDYIELAQNQTLLGLSSQALNSIKKAHQLDPIRSDIDRLYYSTLQ